MKYTKEGKIVLAIRLMVIVFGLSCLYALVSTNPQSRYEMMNRTINAIYVTAFGISSLILTVLLALKVGFVRWLILIWDIVFILCLLLLSLLGVSVEIVVLILILAIEASCLLMAPIAEAK